MQKLSDFCKIEKGASPTLKTPSGRFPLVVTAKDRRTSNSFQFNCESVCVPLVSSTGHGHASIKRIHYQSGKFALANIMSAIIPDKKKCLPKYLFYILSYEKDSLLVPLMHGSANVSLNPEDLQNVEVFLPPISKQMKIVSILDMLVEIKEKLLKEIEITNSLNDALFFKFFGNPITNPKKFPLIPMHSIVEINPPKKELSTTKKDTSVTFLPMAAVSEEGEILKRETKKLSQVLKGYTYFKEEDVLFAKITPCMENGKCTVATNLKNQIGFGSTEFFVLRPSQKINNDWLFYFMRLQVIRKFAEKNMTGTAGQQRVPKSFLENLKIPTPSLNQQETFVSIMKEINEISKKQSIYQVQFLALQNSVHSSVFNNS